VYLIENSEKISGVLFWSCFVQVPFYSRIRKILKLCLPSRWFNYCQRTTVQELDPGDQTNSRFSERSPKRMNSTSEETKMQESQDILEDLENSKDELILQQPNLLDDDDDEKTDEDLTEEDDSIMEYIPTVCTSVKDVGVATDPNIRFRSTMEDEHIILDGFGNDPSCGYFAVYDGHGGRDAVEYTLKYLHENLLKEMQAMGNNEIENIEEALKMAYLTTDANMGDYFSQNGIHSSGTTTCSALIRKSKTGKERWLYVANCGDARAVLGRDGKAIRLSYDHKATDENEIKRIVDLGGCIIMKRVNGILAVSRSLGDCAMKTYVSGDPYITKTLLREDDKHLIVACDGLWDVASDQQALDLIQSEDLTAQQKSKKLLSYALNNSSTDNISIMVIEL